MLRRLNDGSFPVSWRTAAARWSPDPVVGLRSGVSAEPRNGTPLPPEAQAVNPGSLPRDIPPGAVDSRRGARRRDRQGGSGCAEPPARTVRRRRIHGKDTAERIRRTGEDTLLVLTTNDERELPPAFVRRRVTLSLADEPTEEWFRIARRRMKERRSRCLQSRGRCSSGARRLAPQECVAQVLPVFDADLACRELGIDRDSDAWQQVARSVLWKQEKEPPSQDG